MKEFHKINIKTTIVWHMTPCSPVEIYQKIILTPPSGVKIKTNKTTGMSACLFNLFFDLKTESIRTFEKLIIYCTS
jgi:hypothetical protein